MKFKLIFFPLCLVCFYILSCGNQHYEKKKITNINRTDAADSFIVVVNQSGAKSTEFKYFDHFGNSERSFLLNNETFKIKGLYSITAYIIKSKDFTDLTYYTLYPKDTVFIKANGEFFANNKLLNERFDLMRKLKFFPGSVNFAIRDNLANVNKTVAKNFAVKKLIIDSLAGKFDKKIINEATNIVNYEHLANVLAMATRFNNIREDTLLRFAKNSDGNSWNYLTYRDYLQRFGDYIIKVNRLGNLSAYCSYLRRYLTQTTADQAIFLKLNSFKPNYTSDLDTLSKLTISYDKESKNKEFAAYLMANLKLFKLNQNVGESNKIQLFGTTGNQPLSFETLLAQNKGKLIYIDFWASWCTPCIAEMPASIASLNYFDRKKAPITFVYISTDKDMSAWKNKANALGISKYNSFILLQNKALTDFNKRFKLNTIPRYMIISQDGTILNSDAPRPSDPTFKMLFEKLIK